MRAPSCRRYMYCVTRSVRACDNNKEMIIVYMRVCVWRSYVPCVNTLARPMRDFNVYTLHYTGRVAIATTRVCVRCPRDALDLILDTRAFLSLLLLLVSLCECPRHNCPSRCLRCAMLLGGERAVDVSRSGWPTATCT